MTIAKIFLLHFFDDFIVWVTIVEGEGGGKRKVDLSEWRRNLDLILIVFGIKIVEIILV